MELIDYSQDARGNPCADASDGIMYVITELAQYSLKDYLSLRRDQRKNISLDAVKNISKAIIMVVAGLHAKGFVHLDLKPENLMMFNGRLKLIDVDGCVRADSDVSIQDSSISFSPCYCAPEWARFLTEESESKIVARPHLDVWSIGMTLCELAILDPILKPTYANFLRNGHSHREAGFLFMDWLGSIKKAPLPKHIEGHDPEFFRMVTENLLVCDFKIRKTLCQCMDDVYFQNDGSSALGKPSAKGETEPSKLGRGGSSHLPEEVVERKVRNRLEDLSSNAPVHQGTLWKLNNNGKIEDATHWLKRDMWVACNGSLCYFSIKENRRLVLVDASRLVAAKIEACEQSAYEFSFQISATSDEHESDINLVFAAESAEEFQKWTSSLTSVANMDAVMQTMRLGGEMAAELKTFRLTVKNRRMKVIDDEKDQFAAIFKAKLWKVKAEGDRTKEGDWFEREMWISKNGSLVYWSKKEDRDLIYYTSDDMARARFTLIPKEASFKPWAFQVQLPPNGDVEFAPGEFAAETEAMRECWLEEFNKLQTLT
ncbi:unnamed protein product [Polarella glacialis]|uniref:Uncharacterized protein n=1 Tax=Polarella glacialis TaxID=89957 RepID=A0A813GVS6_POLGL|nr:unnamed protein product [Polarella glacialis]